MMAVRRPILITGCQRSGTTLVNLILDSHPDVVSLDEDRFAFPALSNYLSVPNGPPFLAFKLPQYAHMMEFIEMLPDRRVLWCVRDPLDTVQSMIGLTLDSAGLESPWAAHPNGGWFEINNAYWALRDDQKEALQAPVAQFAELTKKLAELAQSPAEFAAIERRDCVFMAALCWAIKNALPALYRDRGIDFQVVRYEELVTEPGERIAGLLDYVGAGWHDNVLQHHRLHAGTSIGQTSNTRAIDRQGLGQGRRHLSEDERALVKWVCEPTAAEWGYALG